MTMQSSSSEELAEIVGGFKQLRILVIGDMVADRYLIGRPMRISREAPVIVLHQTDDFVCPGGAANVAANIAALGAVAVVIGVIGEDENGSMLCHSLRELGVEVSGLRRDPHASTVTKTRVVGRGAQEAQQQMVRIDQVATSRTDEAIETALIQAMSEQLNDCGGVVISDYENGLLSPQLIAALLPAAKADGRVVAVDSHGDLLRFRGITAATPNQPEAEATLGRRISSIEDLEDAGSTLRDRMDADAVLLTRGNEGMSLFTRDFAPVHLPPTNLREVYDPTGAGDTACAVFTMALMAGASMHQAALLSNIAAGEVVKQLGAATLTPDRLRQLATSSPE
jgi:rfaE bifunctional protein kinase chain/domain